MRSEPHHVLRGLLLGCGLMLLGACDGPALSALDEGTASDGEPGSDADDDDASPSSGAAPPRFGDPLPLVDGESWRPASAQEDPLGPERPAQVEGPSAAWGPELGGLEIQTGSCNYFFAVQPSLAAIEAGDAIDVVVFHDRLDAAEPAEGHVAILLGDEVAWEEHVEIPAQARVLEARVIAERAWPAGTLVGLHLHNHGYNAWTVLEVSMAPAQ